jgi:Raf kinase inhibitor-like YbhB/YbcL family protein
MEDPDAPSGTFVHWVAWGLEPGLRQLPEGVEPPVEGRNGFGTVGYRGPCPPKGHHPHHYVIRLYALQVVPNLPPASTIADLQDVIAEELVEAAELVGTYERP